VVCGAPEVVRNLPRHPGELKPELCLGILTEGRHGPSDWLFRQGNEQLVVPPKGALNFNSSDALVNAAMQGAGLIYVLDIFVNRRIAAGKLVQAYCDWSTSMRTFYAVTAKAQFVAPKVRGFIDFLLETLDAEQRPSARKLVGVKGSETRR